jgi:hypothetical protein
MWDETTAQTWKQKEMNPFDNHQKRIQAPMCESLPANKKPEKRGLHVKESRMVFTQYRLLTSGPSFVSRTRLAIRHPPTTALERRGGNNARQQQQNQDHLQ